MSNTKRRSAVLPAVPALDTPTPQPAALAVQAVGCIVCGQPSVCTGMQTIMPPTIADGAEPTPEEAAAIANGYRMILHLVCPQHHRWQVAWVQQPGQPCLSLLADQDGQVYTVAALQELQRRQVALSSIIVPGGRA